MLLIEPNIRQTPCFVIDAFYYMYLSHDKICRVVQICKIREAISGEALCVRTK